MLFAGDATVELLPLDLLLLEFLVPPRLERAEALVEPVRCAAIEPDRRSRQIGEEAPVVADQGKR